MGWAVFRAWSVAIVVAAFVAYLAMQLVFGIDVARLLEAASIARRERKRAVIGRGSLSRPGRSVRGRPRPGDRR